MIPPEDCQSMDELRHQIDTLDRQIVAALARRAGYIDRAAELKPKERLPARIEARVCEVLDNVRACARAEGWDEKLAETLWREMIEWSIRREETAMAAKETRT
ncbi:chorismate mutase [Rhodovulum imhoffii]|uniref:chorismate mutase n=1 Tax=Rhodovulum imhoffii TaxID=365340 RepID=A0A2T5BSW9_9RHOB|nr:chorismate mutase [Rhodovulum imhoffii]MBK5932713.1 chorismate mutase [Rhodovulum imhoffii]PTN02471.1 chorismate mutase [Rhodovulum imhoffii]